MDANQKSDEMFLRCASENTIVTFGLLDTDLHRFMLLEQQGFRVMSGEKTDMVAVSAFLVVIDDITLQNGGDWSYEDTLAVCREIKSDYEFFCFIGDKKDNNDTPKLSGKIFLPRYMLENQDELNQFILSVKKRYISLRKRSITRINKLKSMILIYEYAKQNKTITTREVAQRLDINVRTVIRYLKELNEATYSLSYDKKSHKWVYHQEIDEIEEYLQKNQERKKEKK